MTARKTGKPRSPRRKTASDPVREDLSANIVSLTGLMARMMEKSGEEEEFDRLMAFMEKYSRASTCLATLLKAQRSLDEEQGVGEALSQALQMALDSFPGVNRE